MSITSSLESDPGALDSPEALPAMPRDTEAQPAWTRQSEHGQLTFYANELREANFRPRTDLKVPAVVELMALADPRPEHRIKYLLVNLYGLDSVDSEVSCSFNPMTEGMRIALLRAEPTDRVLARFFMRKIDPLRQFTYAESRQDALAFLLCND